MMKPSSSMAVLLGVTSLLSIAPMTGVEGHVYLMGPVSRQLYGTSAFQKQGAEGINYCPHCFQSRGPAAIRERGGGAPWPHFNGERAENGNYIESDEISKRHGICGDPEQTAAEGSNLYGMENSNYPVLETLAEGDILEVKIVVSTYHWGHVEMFICDAEDLPDGPDGLLTQSCFNKHPLDRAEDDEDQGGPIDPKNRGRFFLDPQCRAGETDQEMVPGATPGDVATARYQLPKGLTCKHCTVQMVYYTGNSCKHQGYEEFNPPSWPSKCAPTKADWINEVVGQCGDGDAYPEEFWNCADIEITSGGTPTEPESDDGTDDGGDDQDDGGDDGGDDGNDDGGDDGGNDDGNDDGGNDNGSNDGNDDGSDDGGNDYGGDDDGGDGGGDDDGDDDDEGCADPVREHDQCGGTGYTGSTCCDSGLQCQKMAKCWSECRMAKPGSEEEGEPERRESPEDGESKEGEPEQREEEEGEPEQREEEEGEPEQRESSENSGSSEDGSGGSEEEGECAEMYGKCGGVNWSGPTCCKNGAECAKYSDYHYQCQPAGK